MIDDARKNRLLSFLRAAASDAEQFRDDVAIADALSHYKGKPLGNEQEGRSQVQTRDVAEVVDQATVDILEKMVSGDRVVAFTADHDEATGQPDPSEEITEAVHYEFMRRRDGASGYLVLHSAIKAGLMERRGVVKTRVDAKKVKRSFDVPESALGDDDLSGDVAATEQVTEAGEPIYRVTRVDEVKVVRTEAVPNEEVLVSRGATDFESADYVAHCRSLKLSEVRAMGFAVDEGMADATIAAALKIERDGLASGVDETGARAKVSLYEEYIRFDIDGDGMDERVCVHRIGDTILSMEEVDSQPFDHWTPFPMQHRVDGESMADKTMDIQAINTSLLRNGLDSLYLSNLPRVWLNENSMNEWTIDDLLSPAAGQIVRGRGEMPPQPIQTRDASGSAFQAIEFTLGMRDSRTGISRHNQGLSADSLNKTATGMGLLQDNADKIRQYLARNFAEMMVGPMFQRRYHLMRQHATPFTMTIDGKRRRVDPATWPEEIDMDVAVGLGSNRREQRVQARAQVMAVQEKAMAAGLPIVTPEHVYNSAKGLVRDLSLGNPSEYFAAPADAGPQPERPDPEAMKVEVEAQRRKDEMNFRFWEAEQKIKLEREKIEMEDARERWRMVREFELAAANVGQHAYHPGGALDR